MPNDIAGLLRDVRDVLYWALSDYDSQWYGYAWRYDQGLDNLVVSFCFDGVSMEFYISHDLEYCVYDDLYYTFDAEAVWRSIAFEAIRQRGRV
jgi:hypothetical protein